MTNAAVAHLWAARSDLQLLSDQLAGMAAWYLAQREQRPPEGGVVTREMRLDLSRRTEARRREQAALLERAREQLDQTRRPPQHGRQPRAVLVHRREWVRLKVEQELARHGIAVVGHLDNGADAVGLAIVEQPDLMLVEDALPMVSGTEVIRAMRVFCSRTLVAAHVESDSGVAAALHAGAATAFPRLVPPEHIARGLASLVGAG